jgi:hypothetical protein
MISADAVRKIENQRKELRKEIYKKIYEQFSRKIKSSVELGMKQVFLKVPPFMLGYPSYDIKKAGDYLERQLQLSGFDTARVTDSDIHVSWGTKKKSKEKQVIRHTQEQEPIDEDGLPTLINLKKLASKYKNA